MPMKMPAPMASAANAGGRRIEEPRVGGDAAAPEQTFAEACDQNVDSRIQIRLGALWARSRAYCLSSSATWGCGSWVFIT